MAMSEFFSDERKWQEKFVDIIKKTMFGGFTYSEFSSYGNAIPDLCIRGTSSEVPVIFEFKNELLNTLWEPNFQAISCYINCQSSHARQRALTLLITCIDCSHLQVFGAAWNKGDLCVDPLCQPLSLLHVPHDPTCGFQKLAHVLCAADAVVKEQYSPEQRKSGPYFTNFDNYEITYQKAIKNLVCLLPPWLERVYARML